MEFLMTYGWALLILILVITALAFFGVLNPANLAPEQCLLGPGLACESYRAVNDSSQGVDNPKIMINVRNGMGKILDIFIIYVDKKDITSGTNVCGGFAGFISFPTTDPDINAIAGPFEDGTVKSIRSVTSTVTNTYGLNCNTHPNLVITNCCTKFYLLAGCTPPTDPPDRCKICDDNYRCTTSIEPFPDPGKKLSADIVIVYRELGSYILHQRIGRLTTQVE